MLTQAQKDEYDRGGAIVVPDVLTAEEVEELRRVTDGFVERSRRVAAHDAIYDLEDSHTPEQPRVRRIKAPHLHHPAYARLVRHPGIVAVLQDLWGPDIRFDTAKLNMKSAGFGAAVEWHQDWAFYPHTNDDLAAVGVMMDDMAMENGPLLIAPGSHKGPVFDHHGEDGRFCGAMDPTRREVDYAAAVPLTGRAGSITVHHVRAVHGSAPNLSDRDRRLLLFQFRAADAWPLLGFPGGIEAYDALMVSGRPSLEPRLAPVPVRLPLPPAALQGSIYENQKGLKARFFDAPPTTAAPARAPEAVPGE
jgi:ectoine hydroxylase-related dioxygenase (phytanoyl-CoA dioxygenase family)